MSLVGGGRPGRIGFGSGGRVRRFKAQMPLCPCEGVSARRSHPAPGVTLRTYTHLPPSSETRTRKAIDDAFAGDPDGDQGTSVPLGATNVPSTCPGHLKAPPGTCRGRSPKAPPKPYAASAHGHTRQYG
ncbi:hypothetical protein GCM10010389_56560 [Streptomyces echinoruber]|uniref:Uncharacterized protein n=1 Tax=Streptomyces echinoruber TaxID=68898 RepID=A0A918RR83_9ACTN|nr:hypothetical protein GCM10010389_56560 [Streptomyces echinoruber]